MSFQAVACISGDKGEVQAQLCLATSQIHKLHLGLHNRGAGKPMQWSSQVKTYNTGDFFGEIALLLGEPRKACLQMHPVGMNGECLHALSGECLRQRTCDLPCNHKASVR